MMIRIPIPAAPRAGLQNARSTTFRRLNCAILVFAAAFAVGVVQAQQPGSARSIAKLTGLQGNVLVSQADGMAAAVEGQALPPGARVFTTAGAKVTITYERGCLVSLGENRRYTVREAAECVAAKAPPLGAAAPFAVLAGPQVVNSGGSVVRGDLGVSPRNRSRRFPWRQGRGRHDSKFRRNAESRAERRRQGLCGARQPAVQRQADRAGSRRTDVHAGRLLFSGGRRNADGRARAGRPGRPGRGLRLSGRDHADDGGRVVGARDQSRSGCRVQFPGGDAPARPLCNVYWQVGDSAAIGRDSTFIGTIIAIDRINVAANAAIDGRALARTGNVILDTDTIQIPQCFMRHRVLGRGRRGDRRSSAPG